MCGPLCKLVKPQCLPFSSQEVQSPWPSAIKAGEPFHSAVKWGGGVECEGVKTQHHRVRVLHEAKLRVDKMMFLMLLDHIHFQNNSIEKSYF